MKIKIVKRPRHIAFYVDKTWTSDLVVEYALYIWGMTKYKGEEGWDYISAFVSEQSALDFAKQHKALTEEKEFEL